MKKVIIIGGGFAGALAAKKLEKEKFSVTLIDAKDYFEFTPSVLRTIVEPEHIKKIQILHRHYLSKTRIIVGEVKKISEKNVIVKPINDFQRKLYFDYLVIASGSSYNFPMKEKNLVISTRANTLRDCYEKLCSSEKILIIGGGLVGVELAAEITGHYGMENKKIRIVQAYPELIERNPKKARQYAKRFLEKNGVKIIFNEMVVKGNKGTFTTDKGTKIKTDMAFLCTGITPNFKFMEENFSSLLNKENQVKVNQYLQLQGFNNIFVAGDIISIKEEKTAQNAECHAKIVVNNIKALEKKQKLKEYKPRPRIMVISLGKRNGILTYKNLSLTGIIPGVLKTLIERKTMKRYKS